MRNVSLIPRTILLLLVLLLVMPVVASAEAPADFKDTQTDFRLPGSGNQIVGPHMVYRAFDKQNNSQVYYRNMTTGEFKQITDTPNSKDTAGIGINSDGQIVLIWKQEKNPEKHDYIWDVYSHNLTTGVTKKHNQTDGLYTELQVKGNYLVYFNYDQRTFYIDNLKDGTEAAVEKGEFPVLHDGKIVYNTQNGHAVSVYDLKTGKAEEIYVLPEGDLGFGNLFNGKYFLMVLDGDQSDEAKYALLNIETKQAQDLTDWAIRSVWGFMSMGDSYAVFLTNPKDSKVKQFYWVDLAGGRVKEMSNPADFYVYFDFIGDQLVMQGNKKGDKAFYRTLNGTEDRAASLFPKPVPPFKPVTIEKTVGGKGGTMTADGGKAVLAIAKGAFAKNAKLKLTSASPVTGSKEIVTSTIWKLSSDQKWTKGVTLTLAYNPGLSAGKSPEIAIYDAKAAAWKPITGKADAKKSVVTAAISAAGTYAVIVK